MVSFPMERFLHILKCVLYTCSLLFMCTSLNFHAFVYCMQPPMTQSRKDIIMRAFKKLDKTGDGQITVEDLKGWVCFG